MDFHEAILYNDDSLCNRYKDGSVLQLSPCASAFRFYPSSSSKSSHVQQLSRFAVSTYKKPVISAISSRNQFACHPYLCKELLNKENIIVCYEEIKQCTWPKTALPDFTVCNSDGSIVVKSLDGHASFVLCSHKKTFTLSYLSKVNPDSMQPQAAQKKHHFYTWVQRGEQSVDECEECWLYPLRMAFSIGNGVKTMSEELSTMSNVSELPVSLPITCPAAHTHKWIPKEVFCGKENEEVFWQPNLKALWKNGVLYRVYKSQKEMLKIEIYPGDGSVIFSSNFTGRFFTHSTGFSEDKMYSIDQTPPDKPGMKYSIAKLIRQGARLFEFMLQVSFYSNSFHSNNQVIQACWESKTIDVQQDLAAEKAPLQILETATIPNIGRFVAYSNGHLHVAFADRTMLNVRYPKTGPQALAQIGILERGLVFNMILPNGQAVRVNDQTMCGLERYIKLACEWGDWVNSSPQQRRSFYEDSIHHQDQKRIVDSEISKLKRFHYILNNGPLKQILMNPNQNHSQKDEQGKEGLSAVITHDTPSVNDALKKTSEAIKDIETFLHSNTVKKTI